MTVNLIDSKAKAKLNWKQTTLLEHGEKTVTTSNMVYPIMERATQISILVDEKASKMSLKDIDTLVSEIAVITNAVVNDLTPSQGEVVASKLSPALVTLNERVDALKARSSARLAVGWLPLVAVLGIAGAIISVIVNAVN